MKTLLTAAALAILAASTLTTSGCLVISDNKTLDCTERKSCTGDPPPAAFTEKGLPRSAFLVGGGYELKYQAPRPGMIYVVEKTTGRIVVTSLLETGEIYDQTFSPNDDMAMETFGKSFHELNFQLYFVPSSVSVIEPAPATAA